MLSDPGVEYPGTPPHERVTVNAEVVSTTVIAPLLPGAGAMVFSS
jgi:hypothetical protein